jgi:NAD(P)-dependent dehydrogenase (short-subunit alcohol dehydrogenase family)
MSNSPVAIVTGASRGIGRAGALALAEAGFDVVVSARTVREGEGVAEPNSVREETTLAVPGSLERTAQEIEERGQRALIVPMDLIDVASVKALPATVMAEWGRIDVLFNNAIFRGVGTLDRITDLTIESMTNLLAGNFMNQIVLIQEVIPHMLAAGGGTIIDMVSGSARLDPAGPPGEGGWGILYSASKAAFVRVAGGVNAEYRAQGIKAFNVDPGNVVTEARKAAKPDDEYSTGYGSEPAEATGRAGADDFLAPPGPLLRRARGRARPQRTPQGVRRVPTAG